MTPRRDSFRVRGQRVLSCLVFRRGGEVVLGRVRMEPRGRAGREREHGGNWSMENIRHGMKSQLIEELEIQVTKTNSLERNLGRGTEKAISLMGD